jgi:hypothetical protein
MQELDGDGLIQLRLHGAVNGAHPALPDDVLDEVLASDNRAEARIRRCVGPLRGDGTLRCSSTTALDGVFW